MEISIAAGRQTWLSAVIQSNWSKACKKIIAMKRRLSFHQQLLENLILLWKAETCKRTLQCAAVGHVAQLVEHPTGMPPMKVRFPGVARDFSPIVNFECRLYYGCLYTPMHNHIYICVHVKDPVVHVNVWWITETLKQPTCIVGIVVWLCHSGKFPMTEIPWGQYL